MRTLQYFWKIKKKMTKKCWKPSPQRLIRNTLTLSRPWAAQTTQREEFIFQNVAYKPTVYKTGSWVLKMYFDTQAVNFTFFTCFWTFMPICQIAFCTSKLCEYYMLFKYPCFSDENKKKVEISKIIFWLKHDIEISNL